LPNGKDTVEPLAPQTLVARIRQGDRTAESELVRRYSRPLMAMLRQRTGNIQRAEDLHQEAFVIVLQRLRTRGIDDPSLVSAFLRQTAINLWIEDRRKEGRRKTYPDTDFVLLERDESADQLGTIIRAEGDRAVRAMLQEMPNARDREVLQRFYILQQEKPAVCEIMRLPAEHFDRVISRARRRFRELIEKKHRQNDERPQ
jgi:RNA polymerase sigma-70 factor, ECF subfamily